MMICVTILNLGILIFQLARPSLVEAIDGGSGSAPAVLRGSGLEIVDEQGRVRASIKLHAADPKYKMPDGKIGLPETVMLRLIDGKGRPEVKIGASEEGGGLGLVGESDTTHIILEAQRDGSSLKLNNKDGKQQVIKP